MKKSVFAAILLTFVFIFTGCSGKEFSGSEKSVQGSQSSKNDQKARVEISFPFTKEKGTATNQFAVWIEDDKSNLIKTIYVTKFTAKGGYKKRKDVVPAWVKQAKPEEMTKKDLDAVSGATPKTGNLKYTWDCTDQNGSPVPSGNYKFFVEGTLYWESRVLYSGTIAVGGDSQIQAEVSSEYSKEDSANKDMIGAVTAVYMPK